MDWSGYHFLQSLTTVIRGGNKDRADSEASGGGGVPERWHHIWYQTKTHPNFPNIFVRIWSKQIKIYFIRFAATLNHRWTESLWFVSALFLKFWEHQPRGSTAVTLWFSPCAYLITVLYRVSSFQQSAHFIYSLIMASCLLIMLFVNLSLLCPSSTYSQSCNFHTEIPIFCPIVLMALC